MKEKKVWTHHTSGLVVVQVHHVANVASLLAGVDELARELDAELDVVGTAAPLPVGAGRAALRVIARARLDGALGAGPRHRVRHRRRHQRVDERRFATGWPQKTKKTTKKTHTKQIRPTRSNKQTKWKEKSAGFETRKKNT